ncbi:MAG: exodeoxyribonuclease VII small subunit [Planctomycetota bacterium]
MAKKRTPTKTASTEQTFEERMAQLEGLIDRIESGEVGLEQSIAAYEEGIGIIESCRKTLQNAELRVVELTERLETPVRGDDGGAGDP